ncbi:MAG: SDR family oxidoreductase [Sandaracinaceae bacterium]|nr:SDR family oxidoreductase [Sandaracinaceae bacterium]
MEIALLGGTGPTGRLVIAAALRDGHRVRALVRPPRPGSVARALPLREGLEQRTGDATDPAAVSALVEGCDAAICLVGPVKESAPDVCRLAASALIAGARATGLGRIVLVTGAMVGHPASHAHGLYRVVPALLGAVREDRRESERVVREGMRELGRPYVIVRPPRLDDGPTAGWVTIGPTIEIGTMDNIPRVDLAEVLLEACTTGRWDGEEIGARTARQRERGAEAHRLPFARQRTDTARLPKRP